MHRSKRGYRFMGGLLGILVLWILFPLGAFGGTPAAGEAFPDLVLPAPSDPQLLNYLGLKAGQESFRLSEIDAPALIIEIYSMYCPHCQREAPTLNDLHTKIETSPTLGGKLKLIGIGVGNSAFEVDVFRKKYNVTFPLFPDGDFVIHQQLGEVRTPYFFGLHLKADRPLVLFFSQLGGAKDAGELLEELIQTANLE